MQPIDGKYYTANAYHVFGTSSSVDLNHPFNTIEEAYIYLDDIMPCGYGDDGWSIYQYDKSQVNCISDGFIRCDRGCRSPIDCYREKYGINVFDALKYKTRENKESGTKNSGHDQLFQRL